MANMIGNVISIKFVNINVVNNDLSYISNNSLLAAEVGPATGVMGVNIVFSTQQSLDLFGIAIELDPLLVGGLCNPVSSNASILQPVTDCRDGILRWGK